MFKKYKFSILLLFALVFFACERVIDSLGGVTYEYAPLETGKYKIYRVDSTVYDEYNCTVLRSSYQVKEIIGSTGTDGEGDLFYSIERYVRADSTQPWELYNIWSEKIEDNQLQRVEDNQRMVKLVFPVKESRAWDGIVYIRRDTLVPVRGGSIDMYKDWDEFVYNKVDKSFIDTVSNIYYPNALEVMQVNKTNNIERRFSKEVYAKNIGLVYKEMWILDTQCRPRPPGCQGVGNIATCLFTPWQIKAEKGFILTQSLIEHNY